MHGSNSGLNEGVRSLAKHHFLVKYEIQLPILSSGAKWVLSGDKMENKSLNG
jgi:hypothetical protein